VRKGIVMYRCYLGYPINDDGTPPDRCNNDGKYYIKQCKECGNYNHEYDLIEQAIESAKCRIYRLKMSSEDTTYAHQQKAENQQELMRITIDALEYYKNKSKQL
jgi:predicted ATP-dependent serine protease